MNRILKTEQELGFLSFVDIFCIIYFCKIDLRNLNIFLDILQIGKQILIKKNDLILLLHLKALHSLSSPHVQKIIVMLSTSQTLKPLLYCF